MAPAEAPAERQKFWFQYITTPTADTPGTTILLHFDNRRYFFGRISEGTQRACIQRGVGLKKVKDIFLTGPTTWDNMGGLIGMILTMADVQAEEREGVIEGVSPGKKPRVNIHGGPKLTHAMACARRFVFRTGMPLSIHEKSRESFDPDEPGYQDENINVWTVPVIRSSGMSSPVLRNGRSGSPTTVEREQRLREHTVNNMFDSDWRKDKLFESRFDQVKLPALIWTRDSITKELRYTRCTTMDDAPHLEPDSMVMVRHPWPAAMVEDLPPTDNLPGTVAMGYIIRGQPQRGRFLPQKAKALGVAPGPNYAKLAAGQSITLENGNVITPEMVMTEPEAGRGMAVFDIPSYEYLDDLSNKVNRLKDSQAFVGLEMVSWILGPDVYSSPDYQALVKSMSNVRHIVSSPDTNANHIALDSTASSAIRLSNICPECFLEPIYNDEVAYQADETSNTAADVFTVAQRGMIAQLFPKVLLDTSEVPPLFDSAIIKEGVVSTDPRNPTHDSNIENSTIHDNVEILTLGTGSAVPSKYRNVSATLVRIPDVGSYLFDCGENTLGQLRRAYPAEDLDGLLCDLKMIWISHLHADHHLGTLSVIAARNRAVARCSSMGDVTDLHVIAEPNMADYLSDFASIQPSSNCVLLSVLNSQLHFGGSATSIDLFPTNIKKLETVRVSHCHGAQAIAVTFSNDFKFSYSGDCRPSSAFAKIGKDSHVLLHEATFDDGMEGDAMAKKHCTTGEALGVAAAMKAKNVVLTHFSQRYQKLPVLTNIKFADPEKLEQEEVEEVDLDVKGEPDTILADNAHHIAETSAPDSSLNTTLSTDSTGNSLLVDAAATMDMNICVAFDLMRIKYSQIPLINLYYPAIERMFEAEQQKSDLKREEAAIINEKRTAAKQEKSGAKKAANRESVDTGSGTLGERNVYDKNNRAKPPKIARPQGGKQEQSAGAGESGQQLASAHTNVRQTTQAKQRPSKATAKRHRAAEDDANSIVGHNSKQNELHEGLKYDTVLDREHNGRANNENEKEELGHKRPKINNNGADDAESTTPLLPTSELVSTTISEAEPRSSTHVSPQIRQE